MAVSFHRSNHMAIQLLYHMVQWPLFNFLPTKLNVELLYYAMTS